MPILWAGLVNFLFRVRGMVWMGVVFCAESVFWAYAIIWMDKVVWDLFGFFCVCLV